MFYRVGFEFCASYVMSWVVAKAYYVDIGLHYIIVFKSIYQLCNVIYIAEWLRINYVMILAAMVYAPEVLALLL